MATKWAFMVYMAGNNSLSGAAGDDLEELRKVGSTDNVKALAFVKQRGPDGARRLVVGKGGQNEVWDYASAEASSLERYRHVVDRMVGNAVQD